MTGGDAEISIDPDDGLAHCYFERANGELICADLTDDYTETSGYYSTHLVGTHDLRGRDAPVYFTRAGNHYLLTSGSTEGGAHNSVRIAMAQTPHGEFRSLGDALVRPVRSEVDRSRIASVFRHPDATDLYVALVERATRPVSTSDRSEHERFHRYVPGTGASGVARVGWSADYSWLPLRFDGDRPRLEWREDWQLPDFVA
jgi:hypothetical protein